MKNADNVDDVVAKVCHIEGIVHYEFVLHRQTVNQVFYKDILLCLGER